MAYNMKDVFYLDTAIDTGTSTGDGLATLDLSSYVDPIARGRSKGTGLAIYKVHFDICDDDVIHQSQQQLQVLLEPV